MGRLFHNVTNFWAFKGLCGIILKSSFKASSAYLLFDINQKDMKMAQCRYILPKLFLT